MQININNVCSKFKLNKNVSLDDVIISFPDAHIVKQGMSKFKGVHVKIPSYNATSTVSKSGQVVLVGSKSVEDARETAMFLFTVLGGKGDAEFLVTNIASSIKWKQPISLTKLYENLRTKTKPSSMVFEPELGTHCIDLRCSRGMTKIFGTGNMVITGCRCEADILETLHTTLSLINDHYN